MDYVIPIFIYLLIPILGVLLFLYLLSNHTQTEYSGKFGIKLFITFSCIGGLLITFLTNLFWHWSGIASLGMFFLVLVAPILMTIIGYDSYKNKDIVSERYLFFSSILFFGFLLLLLTTALLIN